MRSRYTSIDSPDTARSDSSSDWTSDQDSLFEEDSVSDSEEDSGYEGGDSDEYASSDQEGDNVAQGEWYAAQVESDAMDEEESLRAFLLRLLFLEVDNPVQKSMMFTLYLAVCVFSASPSWFGPQTTLSEIYDVENVTDTFIGNYADADAVAMNAVLRENTLLLTLASFAGIFLEESLPDFLNWLITTSVTASDTYLSVLTGTAAKEDHWGKGPHLYAAAGTTAALLFLLNLRSVTDLYKRQYRKWFFPEETQHIECLETAQMHLRTFPLVDQPKKSAEVFGIRDFPNASSMQIELQFVKNFLNNPQNQEQLRENLKNYCFYNGLMSSSWSFYLIDIPAILYAMVGAMNANYGLVKFLTHLGSPYIATAIPATFAFYAKSCFYGFSLFNIVNLLRNVHSLILGTIQTSKQDWRYGLAVLGIVVCFFSFVPLSGISFFLPVNDLLHFFFKDWVEKRTDFYRYVLLPALGAMGSIANSSGYIALCTRLLNSLRQMIDRNTLSKLGVDKNVADVCTILEEMKTEISKGTAPNKQSILFLVDVMCDLVKKIRESWNNNNELQPELPVFFPHLQDVEDCSLVPEGRRASDGGYDPHNSSNFWLPSSNYGTCSGGRNFVLSPTYR